MAENKSKISKWEWFWLVLTGIIALGGLTLIVLGMIGGLLPVKASDNELLKADEAFQEKMKLSFIWFGVILVLGSALLSTIWLNYFAKKTDKNEERALRRAQRMKIIAASEEAEKPAATEVESTPAKTE